MPYLALVFAIIGLGFSAIFVKLANAPGPVSGFYRMSIAALVLALPFSAQAKQQAPLSKKHLALAALSGLFFAADLGSWNTAVLITNAANATLLGNTSPLWVSLGAVLLFKEKLRPIFWLGLLITLMGSFVILGSDFIQHPTLGWGDLLAAVAGFWYACFFLATQRVREKLSALVTWWISAATSSVALFGLSLAFGNALLGYSTQTWLCFLGIALISQVGGYLAMNYALGHLPASLVAPTMLGQPVVTALLAIPFLGETLGWPQIAGGLLVLLGIWVVNRTR